MPGCRTSGPSSCSIDPSIRELLSDPAPEPARTPSSAGRPASFAACLRTLSWNCVTATDASLFQAPLRAGIRIDACQLEPLWKALRLPRVNLFIADDVGLGKTIEAGLIARELLLRRRASGPSRSRTPDGLATRPCICTWSTASPNACSAASPPRG